jgi:hypothetical protein
VGDGRAEHTPIIPVEAWRGAPHRYVWSGPPLAREDLRFEYVGPPHLSRSAVRSASVGRRVKEVRVEDQPTCGKGLAENAVVPGTLAAATAAMADVLENHMQALDLTDPNANAEHDAYATLVDALRRIAAELRATADQMAGYTDLPMGRHDPQVMTSPDVLHTFEAFVKAKQDLQVLLARQAARDDEMLAQMRRAIGSPP